MTTLSPSKYPEISGDEAHKLLQQGAKFEYIGHLFGYGCHEHGVRITSVTRRDLQKKHLIKNIEDAHVLWSPEQEQQYRADREALQAKRKHNRLEFWATRINNSSDPQAEIETLISISLGLSSADAPATEWELELGMQSTEV